MSRALSSLLVSNVDIQWRRLAFLSSLWILSLANAVAQSPAWTQLLPSGPGPGAIYAHAMAHDSIRGRTVLFGGIGFPLPSVATWEWNGFGWSQMASTGPLLFGGYAMAFDSQRGRVVLFGGGSDTWEWNGATWTMVGNTGPSARSNLAMAYDSARGRTVLFGGAAGGASLADTWEWDGVAWMQGGASGPAGRFGHSMAFDAIRAKVVMFGGYAQGGVNALGDTWELDGATWVLVSTTGPAARARHAMAYDSVRRRCVLYGGVGNAGTGPQYGDTWEWSGLAWVQSAVSGPSARTNTAMAFDVQRGRTLLVGGLLTTSTFTAPLGDVWSWGGGAPPSPSATASAFDSGCGAPPMSLSPEPTGLPVVGATARAIVANVPSPLAVVALGWSNVSVGALPLPEPLDSYGMLGCSLLQSADLLGLPVTFTGASSATYSLPIPLWSSLLGVHVYLQGLAVAPGVNPAGLIVSNGLDWQIGY